MPCILQTVFFERTTLDVILSIFISHVNKLANIVWV